MELAISIDLGGTNIKYALSDRDGNLHSESYLKTESYLGKEAVLEKLHQIINELITKAVTTGNTVKGIGLGSPGIIDHQRKCMIGAGNNFKDWTNVDFKSEVGDPAGLPIWVENDANLAAFGEYHYGSEEKQDFILVTIGTGIGGGIILNNHIYHGAMNSAGEFGQMRVHLASTQSKRTLETWEQYGSCAALQRNYKQQFGQFKSANRLINEYFENSLEYRERCIIDEYITYVTLGLVNIVFTYNPKLILLGGGLSETHENLVPLLETRLKSLFTQSVFQAFQLHKAMLGNKAALLGAAAMVFYDE